MVGLLKRLAKRIYFKIRYSNLILKSKANIDVHSSFSGWNVIGKNSWFKGKMGMCSYIGDYSTIIADIGSFCSIGHNVTTLIGKHPLYPFLSTSPVFYSTAKQNGTTFVKNNKFKEKSEPENLEESSTKIGNDVWIGYGVTILPGIIIGDGAVIGAGSIVTRDIKPFSIVAGNPAKTIRMRFDEQLISMIMKDPWWKKDVDWIKDNAEKFENIELLYRKER